MFVNKLYMFVSFQTCSYTKAILFTYFICLIYAKPTSVPCEVPSDLMVHYKHLTDATNGPLFFSRTPEVPTESMIPSNETKALSKFSTCPWTFREIHDPTTYPPFRTEAICSCKMCNESSSANQCVQVFTKTTVLQRTDQCINGLYVFEPTEIDVPTACVCASVISLIANYDNDSNSNNSINNNNDNTDYEY